MLHKTKHLALAFSLGIIPLSFIFGLSFFIFISCGGGGGDTTPEIVISGYVFDIDGNPISGAKVTISSNPVTVYTNNDGYFSVEVEVGLHEITVTYGAIKIYAATLNCEENHPLHMPQINTSYDPDGNNDDIDGDGYTTDDCDDSNDEIHPGAIEVCDDSLDNDCDGDSDCIDSNCNCSIWYHDADEDGYGDLSESIESETIPSGYVMDNTDCNDNAAEVNPGANEICDDDIDNDCDGYTDCAEPSDMALIPSGCFDMGYPLSEDSSCTAHNFYFRHYVCITSDFYMDVHEVTNAEYAACVSAGGCTAPEYPYSATRSSYYGDQTYENFPVIYVNWNQANEYCTWAGKRLPTEAEWEYAARGGLSRKHYPWGDDISGSDANFRDSGDYWGHDTAPVERHAANGYGLYDVAGNVWEWVNDWYRSTYYCISPINDPPGPDYGTFRIMRGGWWDGDADYLLVWGRLLGDQDVQINSTGFRCAGD